MLQNKIHESIKYNARKGKFPVLGKLTTTQSIEADFHMLMRTFVNERMTGQIKKNNNIER